MESQSVRELKKIASKKKIRGRSKMNRSELINALKKLKSKRVHKKSQETNIKKNKMSDSKRISKVLTYAKSLVGVPYRWHREGDVIQSSDKFWAKNASHVTRKEIDEEDKCIVCTGLINLMRRYQGLSIPGLDGSLNDIEGDQFPGTTGIWFNYLERKGRLEPLDTSRKYPKGTLLIRNFSNVETDQGHVAVIIDEKGSSILDQRIIHAYATMPYKGSEDVKNVGKTGTMKFTSSHYYGTPEGYYTHVCLPENWLLQE